jgi:hypothetical protein
LFGVFHVDGDPCLAHFYFKDISGAIIDDFYTRSTLGPCPCAGDVTGDAVVDILDFLTVLANWGEQSEGPADIDGDGIVGLPEYQLVIALWGRPCR